MKPYATELSKVKDIGLLADSALSRGADLHMDELPMAPWIGKMKFTRTYPIPETEGVGHYRIILARIVPEILALFPRDKYEERDYAGMALSQALKNAFEEGLKNKASEVKVFHSDLSSGLFDFLICSDVRSISPQFVKYWKDLMDGRVDQGIDYYGQYGAARNASQMKKGSGLIEILKFCKDCGFYKSTSGTLLTHLSI